MAGPKRFLASAAIAAGLLGGGVVGVILGVPGVSGAQTTTVLDAPPTTVPAPGGETTPDRPARGDGENCPDKDGAGGSAPSGSSINLDLRRGGGGRI